MKERGASALSYTGLIAVILGSDSKGLDALTLSSKVAKRLIIHGATLGNRGHQACKSVANNNQVHPREVFADVITDRAAGVIFAHNHPSGLL